MIRIGNRTLDFEIRGLLLIFLRTVKRLSCQGYFEKQKTSTDSFGDLDYKMKKEDERLIQE